MEVKDVVKIKAKSKDCLLTVKVKMSFGESVNDAELDAFARKYIRGFLKPKQTKKNLIEYTGPVGVSLYERLKDPISKYDFFFIIEQIIDATQKLQANGFPWNRVIWNLHNVYINSVTKEVQFIYLPLNSTQTGVNLISFIETIIYTAIPVTDQNSDYISQFVYFLKGLPAYDPGKIEKYILKVDRSVVNTIKKHNVGQSGFMTDKKQDYYEHYENNDGDADDTALLDDDEATGLLNEQDDEATGLLNPEDEETGLLIDNDDGTALLVEEPAVQYAKLFRVLTEETISINKPVFRIGKERSYVDYFVTNNNAVSRSHADIVARGNRYFVIDLNSKNHTYINGQILQVHQENEIKNGDSLKLGNEEFIFQI